MEQNINAPQIGMSMKHPSQIKEGEFSLLVNGVIQNVSGDFMMISNEGSNILGTRFKEGFKLIGSNVVTSLSCTFVFLVNPATQESEIGFLFDATNVDKPDVTGADGKIIEQQPLEQTIQYENTHYYTFVSAECLDFDIDHPVTSFIKIDDCNVRIYFNDFKNKPRYIDYKDFQKIDLSNCPLIETDQLDCDKIKVFPESCYPVIEAVDVIPNGQNLAGVYQFSVCYSDVRSNKITDYYYVTNPIPLFDKAITVDNAYPVYKSIKLVISNLNTDFKYFNLAVLKTINNVTSASLVETFEINSSYFEYVYSGVDKNTQLSLSIDEILQKKPYYNAAKITTESNGYLMMANLKEDRILNLQPVVLDIKPKWQNVEMSEDDYANPIVAQNTVGYLGDEVYPKGISFTKTNGKQTNIFLFVNREATPYDLEEIPDTNKDVIEYSSCDSTKPNKRYEVYNTASVDNTPIVCIVDPPSGVKTVTLTDELECVSPTILMVSVSVDSYGNPVPNPIPTFYEYPSTDSSSPLYIGTNPVTGLPYNFPPLSPADNNNIISWISSAPSKIININDYFHNEICDCNSFLPQYPIGATAETIPVNPIVDPLVSNSSVNVSQSEVIFSQNTYNNSSLPTLGNPGNYPYSPTPCKKKDDGGYQDWLDAKSNETRPDSLTVPTSQNASCSINTWGAFLNDPENSTSHSWYNFYPTADGSAAILVATDTTGSPNNNLEVIVYDGATVIANSSSPNYVHSANGVKILLTSLDPTKNYHIEIIGNYDNPGTTGYLLPKRCKRASFKVCVVTPTPVTSTYKVIPTSVTISKTCKITYEGVPENTCKPSPYKQGDFAYWESQETYPCNEEVWSDLAGKPIRHFKYPDHSVIPFYEKKGSIVDKLSTKLNKIYPKGWVVDVNEIKLALDKAVVLGLITFEERNQICGYRLYRGNRRGNESIIAKGLLYDVWEYKDNIYNTGNKILFPNFPYNDLRDNEFVKERQIRNIIQANDISTYIKHPFKEENYKNNKYTLDAPNLSFNNPGLGTEIKIEFEQNGVSVGNYNTLKNNAEYQYIGAGIISASIGFASIEASFEALSVMVNATLTIPLTVVGSGTSIPLGLILALIGENIMSPIRMYSHYGEWYEIIKKFAPFKNYGTTYSSIGKYLSYQDNTIGNYRRTIANAQYIKPGIINVKTIKGNIRFNNYKRDSSVFIELTQDSYFNKPTSIDNSRQLPQDCNTTGVTSDISSYYASLKNPLISQYGQVDNIEWIDTGYNGRINWSDPNQSTACDTIFGGDTYITRFSKKRKVPMFLENRVFNSTTLQVPAQNVDFQMSLIPNIGYPRFFMNYPTSIDYSGLSQSLFGDVAVLSKTRADFNFYCFSSVGKSWADAGLGAAIVGSVSAISFGVVSLPIAVGVISAGVKRDLGNDVFLQGKYIDSFYGLTSFLCESNYNLHYQYGENFKEGNFYPNVEDTNEWTQEYFVPISEDNIYKYNLDYSKQNKENPNFVLNNDFKQEKSDCKITHPNRLIYSLQDKDQDDTYDGNLVFLANNRYDFPKSGGKLQIVRGVGDGKVLVVQENTASVFNSYISQESNIATSTVGSNTMFNQAIPAQFVETDLGYGGAQTPACITTEFGTYWVDNKRAQIMELNIGSKSPFNNIIKPEEEWWFKENLPFHILEDFPEFDVTNNFKYVGMSITYDQRYKRIIITKRDVELKPLYKKHVQYDGTLFHFGEEVFTPEDAKYFCNKSWTLSYSPLLKSFVSYHTYTPNYYIQNQAYFSSGSNYSFNTLPEETGLWHHNLTNQSYQVFYGKLAPFMFEYTLQTKYVNNMLESISYIAEYMRYQDNISYGLVPGLTYNKAYIYNQKQSTGLLELLVKEKNNRQQSYLYSSGKQNVDSRTILTEKINNIWSFNNFYNVATYDSGQPLLSYTCDNIAFKQLNPTSISYKPQFLKEKLVADYHIVRLINDKYSNYLINHRFNLTQTNLYNQ